MRSRFPDCGRGGSRVLHPLLRAGFRVRTARLAVTVHHHPPGIRRHAAPQLASVGRPRERGESRRWMGCITTSSVAAAPLLFRGRTLRVVRVAPLATIPRHPAFVALSPLYFAGLAAWCSGSDAESPRPGRERSLTRPPGRGCACPHHPAPQTRRRLDRCVEAVVRCVPSSRTSCSS